MKRKIYAAGVILSGVLLCACGANKESETMAFETATAAETEAAEEIEEAEEKETEYVHYDDAETFDTFFAFEDALKSQGYYTSDIAPEIGGRNKELYFIYAEPDEDGKAFGFKDDFRTVTFPEWGIERIAVASALFPDDPSDLIKLDESKISKRQLTDEELQKVGLEPGTVVEVPSYSEKIFFTDLGYELNSNACVDLSPLYPGSFTRCSPKDFFQLFVRKTDVEISPDTLGDITGAELLEKLYPYGTYDLGVGQYNIYEKDGVLYVWMALDDEPEKQVVHISKDEMYKRVGVVLMRIEDGVCEGIIYKSNRTASIIESQYVVGRSLIYYGMDKITEGLCEDYLGR